MKLTTLFAVFFLSFFSFSALASFTPADPHPVRIKKIKAKDIEKITGKKLNLFQKCYLRIIQNKLVKQHLKLDDEPMTDKQKKQATASLVLGIASLLFLFIPYIGLLSIPLAILAIIFGAKSVKGNSNAKSIIGIVTGGVTLLVILLAIILIAAALSGGVWG